MLLAMIKIYSWKTWEMEAHSKLITNRPDDLRRNVFFRSVMKADYTALRSEFITNHRLHLTYDFHSYTLRTMGLCCYMHFLQFAWTELLLLDSIDSCDFNPVTWHETAACDGETGRGERLGSN